MLPSLRAYCSPSKLAIVTWLVLKSITGPPNTAPEMFLYTKIAAKSDETSGVTESFSGKPR
jgi:hypothetical protein